MSIYTIVSQVVSALAGVMAGAVAQVINVPQAYAMPLYFWCSVSG